MAAASRTLLCGCLIMASAAAASAQTTPSAQIADPEERVELIMGDLPAQGSPTYQSLIRHAGDAIGQVLPLTRCEMWSVRRKHLDILKQEAAKLNVTVKELGADWNSVLQPMGKAQAVDGKSKEMMDMAMQSKATAGVGMMEPKAANMVEYALTKGMDASGKASSPMSVKIALNDKISVTAVRRSVEIKGNRCVWRGVVDGTDQPVTILWWGSGRMTGTIHHNDRIYQLKQMGKDMIGVVETMTDKMPDEHPRMSRQRMRKMNMRRDTMYERGEASAGRPRPKRGATQDLEDDASNLGKRRPRGMRTAAIDPKAATAPVRGREPASGAAPKVIIDVMAVYTSKASAHYGDIKLDLVELAIDDTNESFRQSGIENVEVRLVHTHKTDYDESTGEHFDHVWRMVDRGDGYMEELPALRDQHKADVVLLIVDDGRGCGLATRVAADASEAFAVVHHECAATTYSFAHEIGHIIGARHDRKLDKSTTPFPFGHGYVEPNLKWRTMMSYRRSCDGCPRLPIWSTPAKVVKDQPAGDETQNNARVIRENAVRVARFR
jgi:hypothetical protein